MTKCLEIFMGAEEVPPSPLVCIYDWKALEKHWDKVYRRRTWKRQMKSITLLNSNKNTSFITDGQDGWFQFSNIQIPQPNLT